MMAISKLNFQIVFHGWNNSMWWKGCIGPNNNLVLLGIIWNKNDQDDLWYLIMSLGFNELIIHLALPRGFGEVLDVIFKMTFLIDNVWIYFISGSTGVQIVFHGWNNSTSPKSRRRAKWIINSLQPSDIIRYHRSSCTLLFQMMPNSTKLLFGPMHPFHHIESFQPWKTIWKFSFKIAISIPRHKRVKGKLKCVITELVINSGISLIIWKP